MDFLFSSYTALRGEKGQPQNAHDTIDKLTDRVTNATLLEIGGQLFSDSRASREIGGWSDVGTKGMPVLINVLTKDRHDVEIVKPTLETLHVLCSSEDAGSPSKVASSPTSPTAMDSRDLGVMFSEIYIKSPTNIALLLDILEEQDFYVRFHAIQLLSTLLQNLGDRLHDSILTKGLLLLIFNEIQRRDSKIIAFETLSKDLGNVIGEGATDGGIMFRMPYIDAKLASIQCVNQLVRILVGPNNPNTSVNQNVIFQAHVINPIIDIALSKACRKSEISDPHLCTDLSLESALKSTEDFAVRAAATFCFQNPNDEAGEQPQSPGSLIVSSILEWETSRKDPYKIWFATVMLSHILRDNLRCKELALGVRFMDDDVMFVLLSANKDSADIRIRVGILSLLATWLLDCHRAVREYLSEGSNLQFLIEQINHSSGVDPLVQGLSSYVMALCHEFNDDSEPAFTQASIQTLIVSRIGSDVFASRIERLRESKQFQKVSPYLLPPETEKESKGLPDVYFDTAFVEQLKSTYGEFNPSVNPKSFHYVSVIDAIIVDALVRAVINPKPKNANQKKEESSQKSLIDSYKSLLATQNKELEEARRVLTESEEKGWKRSTLALSSQINSLVATVKSLELRLAEGTERYTTLSREQDDLLVCLAESDITIRQLKSRLRALGEEVESDGDEEDEEAEEANEANGV
ncbi:p115 like vesicle tethering protein [Chytridium lagenaria]|nr:p115 like vesicle tethering protein [Chytridium lagenaria]